MDVYNQRRQVFQDRIGNAAAIIPSARLAVRNGDAEYEFRQNSDFFYVTGFNEPDAVLLLTQHHEK
jgi:Xaa-Pro aminopeptidase